VRPRRFGVVLSGWSWKYFLLKGAGGSHSGGETPFSVQPHRTARTSRRKSVVVTEPAE
jgi:hypothetical protein